MPERRRDKIIGDNLGAPSASADSTCFASQPDMLIKEAGKAPVSMKQMAEEAILSIGEGSGFVVANSKGPEGFNRIVTAGHVLVDFRSGRRSTSLPVGASDGTFLGNARLVTENNFQQPSFKDDATPKEKLVAHATQSTMSDAVVMVFEPASDAAREKYQRIQGLDLAQHQNNRALVANFGNNAGPTGGQSGDPVLSDEKGAVIGIVTSGGFGEKEGKKVPLKGASLDALVRHANPRDPAEDPLGIMATFDKEKEKQDKNVSIVPPGHVLITPIAQPEVLAALGSAGSEVQVGKSAFKPTPAHFIGYPSPASICKIFSSTVTEWRDERKTPSKSFAPSGNP